VDGAPVAFLGALHRPISRSRRGVPDQNLMGYSRIVTLPDWQGLGIAFVIMDTVAAAYKSIGKRVNSYPAHPSLIRSFDRSPSWSMIARPGFSMTQRGGTDRGRRALSENKIVGGWNAGSRPCATFRYVGPELAAPEARALLRPYLRSLTG
jgi:GNAT superfamily N-acetyltransferase